MTELEKRPDPPAPERPLLKSSQKFATYLSYHLDAEWVGELPIALRVPFKAILTWAKKHQDELFSSVHDDDLDRFFAQYSDLMLQMRSDDAKPVRVVALDGWTEEELAAFDYFQANRAEIERFVENRAAQSNGEALKELPSTRTPGQLDLLEEND